jgi:hypothetical protein
MSEKGKASEGSGQASSLVPMSWESRLYRAHGTGGWSVEVWNPMTKVWERSPNAPFWPAEYEKEAAEWVKLANQEQALRNDEVHPQLP